MKALLLVLMQLIHASSQGAVARIDVDQIDGRFRLSVVAARATRIDPLQLQPEGGLPPGAVSVLVKNGRDEVIGCGSENTPHAAALLGSSTTRGGETKSRRIKKGETYLTSWLDVESIFIYFDECVMPERRGGYEKYKILVTIDTDRGPIFTETEWLDFPGFETSAWAPVLNKNR